MPHRTPPSFPSLPIPNRATTSSGCRRSRAWCGTEDYSLLRRSKREPRSSPRASGTTITTSPYSARLGAITPEQFQAALDRFNLGRFIEAQPISTGLFGQNVFVTSTAGEWVLRGDPHYDWQFPKELFFARLIHERTDVPVPWPYLLDPDTGIFGWQYLLMPRMPGRQTADPAMRSSLSPDDRVGLARALGDMLAQVHALDWPFPGEYSLSANGIVPLNRPWAEMVEASVHRDLERARTHSDRTASEDVAWLESVLDGGREAVEIPFTPSVMLPDFNYNNTVAVRDGERWRISGVFDLMEASVGDGEKDLSRQLAMYVEEDSALARAFLRAYVARRPPRPRFADRLAVYVLAERVIVWEYGQRHAELGWWDPQLTFRAWAEPYLEMSRSLAQDME